MSKEKKEQVIWRTELAKECFDNKSCKYCGCETPAKFYSDDACEDPVRHCYPAMMTTDDWEKYKKENNIQISIE